MTVLLLILAVVLYASSGLLLYKKEMLGPVVSFLALGAVYLTGILPLNLNILITWLCLTLVVTGVSAMQPSAIMMQTRGMGYICLGALTGMCVGLLGYTFTTRLSAIYAIMVLSVLVGIFFGYLLFTRTPEGSQLRVTRSRYFSYLLAKGFPVAISVMMLGVVLILWLFTKDPGAAEGVR